MLIASIFMTQLLLDLQLDETQDLELRKKVYTWYGTWSRSALTMFEMTLAPGAWAKSGN